MIPLFCPNPICVHHSQDTSSDPDFLFWKRAGSYSTQVVGVVQRFRCKSCDIGFSERTFSLDYYTKKTLDPREIFRSISSGESVSSTARHLACSPASVQNRIERLGRNAMAMHATLLQDLHLHEDLVADGFESFDRSQYFPNNHNLLLGKDSQFLFDVTHATLRRKGRMTPSQRRLRAAYETTYRPSPKGLEYACVRLFRTIPALWDRATWPCLVLNTDEHHAYPRSLDQVEPLARANRAGAFVHATYPSTAPRTIQNPLFSANYYDRELRKDIAAFRRESTCYTRNTAAGLLRFMNHLVWHNYCKPHRIVSTAEKPPVHAVVAGIQEERIAPQLAKLFRARSFLSRTRLNPEWKDIWLKRHKTPLKTRAEYVPKYVRVGEAQGS